MDIYPLLALFIAGISLVLLVEPPWSPPRESRRSIDAIEEQFVWHEVLELIDAALSNSLPFILLHR